MVERRLRRGLLRECLGQVVGDIQRPGPTIALDRYFHLVPDLGARGRSCRFVQAEHHPTVADTHRRTLEIHAPDRADDPEPAAATQCRHHVGGQHDIGTATGSSLEHAAKMLAGHGRIVGLAPSVWNPAHRSVGGCRARRGPRFVILDLLLSSDDKSKITRVRAPGEEVRAPWRPLQPWRLRLIYNQMVVDEVTDAAVDQVFHALADATRRDILRRSGPRASSVSRLADAYPMSFAAVQKHVAVLERAGLVTKERRGREQLVRTDPDAVRRARQALDQLETAWRGRVDRMAELLAQDSDPQQNAPTKGHDT